MLLLERSCEVHLCSAAFSLAQDVEHKFHAAGNSELLEDVEEVVFDGMFAEMKLLGDLAVVQPVGDERNDLMLPVR
jgi:hypothetical protein